MFTVGEALKTKALKKAKLVAGEEGLNRIIRHVTVMEVPDIKLWLKGGDFVLTSFYAIQDSVEKQYKLIEDLANLGSAALTIKTGRFIKNIHEKIISIANERKFPILEIPKDVPYINILTPLMQEIIKSDYIFEQKEEFAKQIVFNSYKDDYYIIEKGITLGYKLDKGAFIVILVFVNEVKNICKNAHLGHDELTFTREEVFNAVYSIAEEMKNNHTIINYMVLKTNYGVALILQNQDEETARKSGKKAIQSIRYFFTSYIKEINIIIGSGSIGCGLKSIQRGYEEAGIAMKLGKVLHKDKTHHCYNDIVIYNILLRKCFGNLDEIASSALDGIIGDKELLHTLSTFFECNEDLKKTSEKLFIHKNTLRYRLNRIRDLTGLNIREINGKVKLYLGLIAYKLLSE